MSSNLPSDKNSSNKPVTDPFRDLMKTMNHFLNEKPLRGLLQSIDEFFKTPFPFDPGFQVETRETANEFLVTAQLPGIKKEQIHLNISGNYLTITVENKEMETTEDKRNHLSQQKFVRHNASRTIALPQEINDKNIKASYQDGLLQIRIPREKGKIIEIDD